MNSGTQGQKDEKGNYIVKPKPEPKTAKEKRLKELLALVSDKLKERFENVRESFRILDTDHSNKLSLNEFAQSIETLRLKVSFDDIKLLFDYLDKDK